MLQRDDDTITCLAERASRGPRYTSYPPATEFRPLEAGDVARELAVVATSPHPVSLYVHVPFCRSLY